MHGKETGSKASVRLRRSRLQGLVIRCGPPRSRSSAASQFRVHVELECFHYGQWSPVRMLCLPFCEVPVPARLVTTQSPDHSRKERYAILPKPSTIEFHVRHQPRECRLIKTVYFLRDASSPRCAESTLIGRCSTRLAASRQATSHRPFAHPIVFTAPVVLRVDPAATLAPVDSPQSRSARTPCINCLYNCGHFPLSCERY